MATGRQGQICQFSKTKMCKFELLGMCAKGPQCPFAHGNEELRPLPDLRCTKMCREMLHSGTCSNPSCAYAHSREELRAKMQWPPATVRARRVRAAQVRRGARAQPDAEVAGPQPESKRVDQTGNSNAVAWREAEAAAHNFKYPASETVPVPSSIAFSDRLLTSDWSPLTHGHGMPYLGQDTLSSLETLSATGDPAYVPLQPAFISPSTMSASLMEQTSFFTRGLGSPASTPSDVPSNHAPGTQSLGSAEGSEDGGPGDMDWEEMCVGLSLMAHVAL